MASDHQLQVAPRPGLHTSDPQSDNLLHDLTAALTGGQGVFDFFSGNFSALQDIYQTISTGGDDVWNDGNDSDGKPVQFVQNGSNVLMVGANVHDEDTLRNGTKDKTDYKTVGTVYVTFTTDQGTNVQMLLDVKYAGLGLGSLGLAGPVLKILKIAIRTTVKFLRTLFRSIFDKAAGGEPVENSDEAEDNVQKEMEDAGEVSGEEGAEIGGEEGGELFADVAFGALDAVGVVVAVGAFAVVLILELLKKQITDTVRFYNATGIDVDFGICYVTDGAAMDHGPAKVGDTISVNKVAAPHGLPPFIVPTGKAIYRSDVHFINENTLKGIGWVATAKPNGDFPGFKVMVDIPLEGTNSLFAGFGDDDCGSLYDSQSGNDQNLTADTSAGKYRLRMATNQNSGKSPDPVSMDEGYNYEHLIVLTDGSIDI